MPFLKTQILFLSLFTCQVLSFAEDRIPFYEDYLQKADALGFLENAEAFLEQSPDALEAPRVAMDLMMVGKAANQAKAVSRATDLLLFRYPKSLPSLQFVSSFDQGSPRLVNLLKLKADQGNLEQKEFAISFCRSLLLITRIHGPEFLKDVSLRIRAYLLATQAGVKEIEDLTFSSFKELSEKNNPLGKCLKILISEQDLFSKIEGLSKLSGTDAKFCLSFYLAQLSPEESKSDKMVRFKINQILFGKSPDTKLARELLASLPETLQKSPPWDALLAFSYHLEQDTPKAIEVLQASSGATEKDSQWNDMLVSYADGLTFLENRKKLLVTAIGKAIEKMGSDSGCLFIQADWESNASNSKSVKNSLFLGVDNSSKKIEIQLRKGKKLVMGYQSSAETSSLYGPDSDKIFRFQTSGTFPVPRVSINRDNLTGAFNYNFNLNFGSSFSEFLKSGSSLLENPYIGTTKGREVLWNYTLANKFIWLEPARAAKGGTTYPISSLSRGTSIPNRASVTFDLQGNLESAKFGAVTLSTIRMGDASILKQLPQWPKGEIEQGEEFDFRMFMKMVSVIGDLAQK